jgi:crotonobetainyl-CoA:carnitine CoA-transferase CaiB-like acyl-CoA transferase
VAIRSTRTSPRSSSDVAPWSAPGFPLRFSAFPERLPLEAAVLGDHNDEVLSQYLGYSQERIRALETDGVLKSGDR